ncbi:MAG: hypothetical protein V3V02_01070 [Rhizobiaceae bacterium]
MKLDRFNIISLVIAIACAIGFVVAKDVDIAAGESSLFDKEFFFTIGVTFTVLAFWK